ncbi:MAG: 50S ribosomal protein L10 [Thermoplasmatota archaeon]
MAHVAQWKKDVVKDLENIIKGYRTVAVVEIDRIPSLQLQRLRSDLRESIEFQVAKKNLIEIAMENMKEEKEGVKELCEMMNGQTAVLGTNMNPFKLYKILDSNLQPMPAKGGEEAPEDIVIEAGETPFPPGPIVGELGRVGIPAAIEKGKVIIRKKATPVKKGEVISKDLAKVLTKLDIFPFEVGIVVDGAWEEGLIYKPEDLDIDLEQYRNNLGFGAQAAFNLAVFTAYMTPQTVVPILQRARSEALNLAVFSGIMNKDTKDIILSKAYGGMLALARLLSEEALDEDLQGMIEGAAAPEAAAPAASDGGEAEEKEEEPEEDEVSEEDAVAGLGALFG